MSSANQKRNAKSTTPNSRKVAADATRSAARKQQQSGGTGDSKAKQQLTTDMDASEDHAMDPPAPERVEQPPADLIKLSSTETEPSPSSEESSEPLVESAPIDEIKSPEDTNETAPEAPAAQDQHSNGIEKEATPKFEEDADDPLPSGYGEISMECCEEDLRGWPQVLSKWETDLNKRPKELPDLVRRGIPEALRAEVWQRLAGCYNDEELIAEYAVLLTRECRDEVYVQRDISRTFPAHEFFREPGGPGQRSLYNVCKAYSVHDDEIGYCQGLSFVAAALLTHMPEEQAFCVLVKIMCEYGLRNLYKCGFEELHLRFYQLERFMQDQLPDLFEHFVNSKLEAHMYASQWFLTLFVAKFPLYAVFPILDIYLLDGLPTMFQVAISLLQLSKHELLALDFEGVLKYFRVQLPKKYRTEQSARVLLSTANSRKVHSQLKAYEKEYVQLREQDKARGDQMQRIQRENKKLVISNMRLEHENDDLARELVNSKIELRKQLDMSEDKADTLNKELLAANHYILDLEDEQKRLVSEVAQLKEVCRRELAGTEKELQNHKKIISDYKDIRDQLTRRLEMAESAAKEQLKTFEQVVADCEPCKTKLADIRSGKVSMLANNGLNGSDGALDNTSNGSKTLEERCRELELELAQTKLALVEAECQNQDLQHNLTSAQAALEKSKNNWYSKTVNSIREKGQKLAQRHETVQNKIAASMSRENSRDFNASN